MEKAGEAELIIAKQRNGPVGEFRCDVPEGIHTLRNSRPQRERTSIIVLKTTRCFGEFGAALAPSYGRAALQIGLTRGRAVLDIFSNPSSKGAGAASITCCASIPRSFITSSAGRAHAEVVQSDDFSVETNIFVPNLGDASFDRDAFAAFVRQHFFAVFLWLAVGKPLLKQGMETTRTPAPSFFRCGERMLQFAAAGEDNQVELVVSFFAI